MKKVIPSLFTLGNLLCGFLAMSKTVNGMYVSAAWWIIIAAIFDALDGKVARLTGSSSDFGIEFDSIADVVSFGVAPALLFHSYILADSGTAGFVLAFVYLAAGAFRLARFNMTATTGSKHHFTGMPIPSGAGILSSFVLFGENVWSALIQFDIAVIVLLAASFAMISGFKYATFPRISFTSGKDTMKSMMFFGMIILMIVLPDEVFFPIGIMYLLSGPVGMITAPAAEMVSHVIHKNSH